MTGATFPTNPTKRSPKPQPMKKSPACIIANMIATGRILPQETSFRVTLEHAATAKQSAQRDKARSRAERMNILDG